MNHHLIIFSDSSPKFFGALAHVGEFEMATGPRISFRSSSCRDYRHHGRRRRLGNDRLDFLMPRNAPSVRGVGVALLMSFVTVILDVAQLAKGYMGQDRDELSFGFERSLAPKWIRK